MKCQFFCKDFELLGHMIGRNTITLLPNKIFDALKIPLPETAKQLRKFMGIVNYLSDHLPNLATVAAELYEHTGSKGTKDHRIPITDTYRQAFA